MNDNDMKQLLGYKKYEYLRREEESIGLAVKDNKLLRSNHSRVKQESIRIMENNKVSFYYSTGNVDIQDLIRRSLDFSSFSHIKENYFFYDPKDGQVDRFTKSVKPFNTYNILESELFEKQTLELINSIKKVFEFDNIELDTRSYKVNTYIEGQNYSKSYDSHRTVILIKIKKDNNIFREELNSFTETDKLENLCHKLYLEPCNPQISGNLEIILDPVIVRELVLYIWKIYKKSQSGKKVNHHILDSLSDKIRIFNNPSDENSLGFMPFDHTGKNTCKELIFDKQYNEINYKSKEDYSNVFKNSSYTKNFDITIIPQKYPAVLTMDNGDFKLDDMIKNIRRGIYITRSSNLWQNLLPNGDFRGVIDEGLIIHNGVISGIIRGMYFSGNIFNVLGEDLIGISQEKMTIGYYLDELPYISCKNLMIK